MCFETDEGCSRRSLIKAGGAFAVGLMLAAVLPGNARAQLASPSPESAAEVPTASTLLIRGAHLISMDPEVGELVGGVRVEAGLIKAVGAELSAEGAQVIDGSGMILIPGLVDTHWHMWNGIARSFIPTPAGAAFGEAMIMINGAYSPELSYLSVRLSAAEALNSGITTVYNWAHNIACPEYADAEWKALQESGLMGRFSYGYGQSLGADALMDFADAERIRAQVDAHPDWQFGLATRDPERTDEKVWTREWAFGRELGVPMTTHIAVSREMQKKRAIEALDSRGLLGPDVQLVHCTHASESDCKRIAAAGSPVGLSPFTEMRVGYGLPPVMRLHDTKVRISLSVDNTVLAGNADYFSIMRLMINLATGMAEDQLALAPREVLRWATMGGAEDLGMADHIGSITPGKRADLVLIDSRRLGTVPLTDATAIVTQSVQPSDVDTVIAGGAVRKFGGRLVGVDDGQLIADVERGWAQISERAGF